MDWEPLAARFDTRCAKDVAMADSVGRSYGSKGADPELAMRAGQKLSFLGLQNPYIGSATTQRAHPLSLDNPEMALGQRQVF